MTDYELSKVPSQDAADWIIGWLADVIVLCAIVGAFL